MERDVPSSRPYIDEYLKIFLNNRKVKRVLAQFGPNWRELAVLPISYFHGDQKEQTNEEKRPKHQHITKGQIIVNRLHDLSLFSEQKSMKVRDGKITDLLQSDVEALRNLDDEIYTKMRPTDGPIMSQTTSMLTALYFKIMAGISKDKNINLVILFVPNFAITPESHETVYKPELIEFAYQHAKKVHEKTFLIDRTINHDLPLRTAIYKKPKGDWCLKDKRKVYCRTGHGFTILGKIRRGMLIIQDMAENGLLSIEEDVNFKESLDGYFEQLSPIAAKFIWNSEYSGQ